MKKFKFVIRATLAVMVTLIISCSKDQPEEFNPVQGNTVITSTDSEDDYQARVSTETYEQYEAILDSLYPVGYLIKEQIIEVEDDNETYLVTEVHVSERLKGYFVEIPNQETAYYIDWNGDFITLYNPDDTNATYDLRNDDNYAEIGFSPFEPEGEYAGKFWGQTETTYTYPCGAPTYNCTCKNTIIRYYVFWINVSTTVIPGPINCD